MTGRRLSRLTHCSKSTWLPDLQTVPISFLRPALALLLHSPRLLAPCSGDDRWHTSIDQHQSHPDPASFIPPALPTPFARRHVLHHQDRQSHPTPLRPFPSSCPAAAHLHPSPHRLHAIGCCLRFRRPHPDLPSPSPSAHRPHCLIPSPSTHQQQNSKGTGRSDPRKSIFFPINRCIPVPPFLGALLDGISAAADGVVARAVTILRSLPSIPAAFERSRRGPKRHRHASSCRQGCTIRLSKHMLRRHRGRSLERIYPPFNTRLHINSAVSSESSFGSTPPLPFLEGKRTTVDAPH